jgi:hypothetical protein
VDRVQLREQAKTEAIREATLRSVSKRYRVRKHISVTPSYELLVASLRLGECFNRVTFQNSARGFVLLACCLCPHHHKHNSAPAALVTLTDCGGAKPIQPDETEVVAAGAASVVGPPPPPGCLL